MKKILFAAHSLGLGGIETALITLLEELLKKEYEITLVLEKKEGIFLDALNPKIKIIQYTPSSNSIVPIRKLINLYKQTKFKLKYANKFDFSAAYATYSLSNGFVARTASKNSALWVHIDYLTQNNNNPEEAKKYYKELKCEEFNKIIFVSKESRNNFLKLFPNCSEKAIYCNNLINGQKIIKKSQENIPENHLQKIKNKEAITFLNVGRHDEKQKKLSKLIEAAEMLQKDGLSFRILFVGEGQDTELYKKMVKDKKLEEKILFLGKTKNPYPYYKISDCVILTSDYEGYPVVFIESMILKKPLITTKVSDYEQIESNYGIVTEKDANSIYVAMKNFIENGFKIKEEFNYQKFNSEILEKLKEIFK